MPETTEKQPKSDRRADEFTWVYKPVRTAFRIFYSLMGGVRVYGAENVPATGGVVLASNHASMADPPLIAIAMKRPLRFFAKAELFKVPVIGPLIVKLGAFAVVRGTPDRGALRQAINVLENGEMLVIFPEGQRGDGINLGAPEKGINMIALKAGVPIVPIYIDGSHKILPKGATFPKRARITLRFGKPIDPAEFKPKERSEELGPAIMSAVSALRDEQRASSG